jgi:2-C-methyl-D-erythritol 4-phosphate cytidylyltransferase
MRVTALVPSAGSGNRMVSGKDDKPFLELKGKPLLFYTLFRLEGSALIDDIQLVVKEKYIGQAKRLVEKYAIRKVSGIICGGETRAQSVANGLAETKAADDDIILIHDGVRPFLTEPAIQALIDSAKQYGAAILAVPCTSTIKKVREEGVVEKTVDRKSLWEVQTPQVFKCKIIREAYRKFQDKSSTDDSCLVERLGNKVHIVPGDRSNIKVTVPEDILLAEAILETQNSER